jgi:heat shock protein HtpX
VSRAGALYAARNILKAWAFAVGISALLAGVGYAAGGLRGLSLFVFCGLLLAGATYWYADRAVLGLVGARELPVGEAPGLHSTVERLASVAGVVKPRLYLLPDGYPRALAAGRGPAGSALAVSTGLLGAATPAELEGVLAHELAHVRNRDVVVQTAVVVLAAALVESSRLGGWLERALLFVLGPTAAAFVHLLLSPKREFVADRSAAEICGSPHGLAAALIRLEQASELVEFQANPATEPLYTINPFANEGLAALFETHPPVGERVRRLRELDPSWREKLRAA